MAHNGSIKHLLDPDEILADSALSPGPAEIMDRKIERPIGRLSLFLFLVFIGGGFVYLGFRAGELSIARGGEFFAKSQENRFLARRIIAPRGVFYDRNEEPMVENVPAFGLVFEKDKFLAAGGNLQGLVGRLAALLKKEPGFFFEAGFPEDGDPQRLPSRILIASDVPLSNVAEILFHSAELPGIEIFENYRRSYKDSYAFSHLLGFIGRPSAEDLGHIEGVASEELIGKSGLEYVYDEKLRGSGGKKIVEVNSSGKESRFKLTEEPEEGHSMRLTIDAGLQTLAYNLLRNYTEGKKAGSVVAIDPRDGAALALVSHPGFDANRFGVSLSAAEFRRVSEDPLFPFFNRAVSGEFPAGSTLKPIIGAAALEENIISPDKQIYDPGYIEVPNPYRPGESTRFLDWRAHGWVDFYDAIAQSANVYFYMVGGGFRDQKGLGIGRIKEYLARFGFGERLGIDLPGERPGILPDPEWKSKADPDDPVWRVGDTYNVSIGQGGVKITPLQLAVATAALSNGGTIFEPRLLADSKPQPIRENIISGDSLGHVLKGMRQTVTSGTARLLSEVPAAVAAKTGTAQTTPGKMPHAWVTAFAPYENPEIVLVVMVEHAGEGATVAVPITNEILKWYFSNR